jgi:hypothetical protein
MNATTETSGAMLHLYRNKTSANMDAYVCLLINQESGDDKGVLQINNYGAAPGLYVISYSGHEAVQAWRNQSGASEPVVQVNQYHASGGTEVLRLTQGDVDQPFARVHGTAAAGDLTRSLVDYGDESSSTAQVWIKVYVQDDGNQVTDQAVFLLGYTLA